MFANLSCKSFATFSLILVPTLALADPVADRGYFVGCDEGYCIIASRGFALTMTPDTATPPEVISALSALPVATAIDFEGEMGELGDSSADITLSGFTVAADDPFSASLMAMQGDWTPDGEETPFFVRIVGLDWEEWPGEELADAFALTPNTACADGVEQGGMILSLYRYGDDPAEDACWKVDSVTDTALVLTDLTGDWGTVTYSRVVE